MTRKSQTRKSSGDNITMVVSAKAGLGRPQGFTHREYLKLHDKGHTDHAIEAAAQKRRLKASPVSLPVLKFMERNDE